MSAYKGHRGPNVSQYIANLNQLSPPQDLLAEPQPVEEDFTAFLNADFFDVNNSRNVNVDFAPPIDFDVDLDPEQTQQAKTAGKGPHQTADPSTEATMDFNLNSKSTCQSFAFRLLSFLSLSRLRSIATVVYCLRHVAQWAAGAAHEDPAMCLACILYPHT